MTKIEFITDMISVYRLAHGCDPSEDVIVVKVDAADCEYLRRLSVDAARDLSRALTELVDEIEGL